MWILFGTRRLDQVLREGTFHCADCGTDERYAHHTVRRCFHVFFIPIIPLKLLDEYIECRRCHGLYKTSVLPQLPAAHARGGDRVGRSIKSAVDGPDEYEAKLDHELDKMEP